MDTTLIVISHGFAATLLIAGVAMIRRGRSRALCSNTAPTEGGKETLGAELRPLALPPELPIGKVPVWFYNRMDLVGASFVFCVFALLVMLSALSRPSSIASIDALGLVVSIGFQFFMAGVVLLFVSFRVRPVEWLGLRWVHWPWVFLIAPVAVLFMWLVFGGLHLAGYMQWMESLGVETVQDTVQLIQKSKNPLVLGLMVIAAVVAAPVCEEVVFRGYFYPVLKRFGGAWAGAVCSALFFSLAHGSVAAALPLFLFGCLLVFLYERTGSLWAPIAVHFCFNSATVMVQLAARVFDLPIDGAK